MPTLPVRPARRSPPPGRPVARVPKLTWADSRAGAPGPRWGSVLRAATGVYAEPPPMPTEDTASFPTPPTRGPAASTRGVQSQGRELLADILRILDFGHTLVGGEGAGCDAQEALADWERKRTRPLPTH